MPPRQAPPRSAAQRLARVRNRLARDPQLRSLFLQQNVFVSESDFLDDYLRTQNQRNLRNVSDIVRRTTRRNIRQANYILTGERPAYIVNDNMLDNMNVIMAAIQRFERRIINGEVFVIGDVDDEGYAGNQHHILNANTIGRIRRVLNNEFEDGDESDKQVLENLLRSNRVYINTYNVTSRRGTRVMRPRRNTGSFLPFLHKINDVFVENLLAKFGLWKEVLASNYDINCLVHSLKESVSQEVLNDLATCVKNKTVPRKHLKHIGEKYNLLFTVHTDQAKFISQYGPKDGENIELVLYKNHYFPFVKDTGVTGFAIRNWVECKERYKNSKAWYKKKDWKASNGAGISSMKLVKIICESDDLSTNIDMSNSTIWETVYLDDVRNFDINSLEYTDKSVHLIHAPRGQYEDKEDYQANIVNIKRNRRLILQRDGGEETIKRLDKQIKELKLGYEEQDALIRSNIIPEATIFFDFESCSQEYHAAYLVAWQVQDEEEIFHSAGSYCALEFLEWLDFYYGFEASAEHPKCLTLIAHNVSYDLSFLLEFLDSGSLKAIKNGSKFLSLTGHYNNLQITFKDSYKIIPSALRNFSSMFHLNSEKEIMPYDLYDHEFICGDFLATPQEIVKLYSEDFVEAMKPNISKWSCETECGKWDMLKYSLKYCEIDVQLLNQGWNSFRKMTLDFFNIDINAKEIISVAGMSYRHLMNHCFEGVYSVSGIVLEFLRRATVGGQTQSCNNMKVNVEGSIFDQDKVSLYPAAMVSMQGIPLGKPKPFYKEIPEGSDYFFVQIEIVKVEGPHYDFPILTIRNDEGINEWRNNVEGCCIVIGKQTLQDLIKWNNVFEYRVIQGYYWDEGWNDNLGKAIQSMYDMRAKLKQENNPAQLIFKLLMNASYGRTGLKPIDDEEKYLTAEHLDRFIFNNHDRITSINVMPNGDTRVKLLKPIHTHFNQQYIAAMILEEAKHLMRKVLLLQQHTGSPLMGRIYYTDTDSIHISQEAWEEVQQLYLERYNETLQGKALGQFHSDFEIEGTYQCKDFKLVRSIVTKEELNGGSLYSKHLIVCGKKSYLDVLTCDKNQSVELFHFRMKGISEQAMIDKCNTDYAGDIVQVYQDLYDGTPVTFKLKGLFKTDLNCKIHTITQPRVVQFK